MAFNCKQITMYWYSAGGAITPGLFLGTGGAPHGFAVIPGGGAGDRVVGVSLDSSAGTNGDPVAVAIRGMVEVVTGGAVAIGDQVTPDSAGKAITATGTKSMCGTALEAASGADETITILLGYQGQALE